MIHLTFAQWLALRYPPARRVGNVSRNQLMQPFWAHHNGGAPYKLGMGVPLEFAAAVIVLLTIVVWCVRRGARPNRGY